ncbi:hypothetical protein ABS764_03860 [Flavobacterium sp. ST-87]|uniref:Outer membrane protein beta-barrel domain-containing protein n=1 Tax=Flavobacterium plantiphilum TaxID=3163297 RepID=A0ABW8XQ23_9FLAO
MKKIALPILLFCLIILSSCKSGNYKYFAPTVNPVLFHDKGEVHVSAEVGTSGFTTKAAVALTEHFGVMGMYNGGGLGNYRSHEGEVAAGYFTKNLYVSGGMGFGSNFAFTDSTHVAKQYEGSFRRPFVQLNAGISGGKIIGGIKGDAVFCLKNSYLFYDGNHLNTTKDQIHSEYFVVEPGFLMGLGSKAFRFDFLLGFPIHFTNNPLSKYSNARTYPLNVGFGIRFIIGRKNNEI